MLIALDPARAITDRFVRARRLVADSMSPASPLGRTYQGYIKAMLRCGHTLLEQVQVHLRSMVGHIAGKHWKRFGFVVFTVDGTKIDCPRTIANEEAFGTAGKRGCGPQQLLTMLLHMGTGLPWAWRTGRADASERSHLREMAHLLPKGSLLVADAGFTGFDLLSELHDHGMHFLIRVGANVTLLRKLGVSVREDGQTVYLWPNHRRREKPLVLRMIRVQGKKGKVIVLVSNVLDPELLSDANAHALYRMRWGVEVFYRSLKQTLEQRKMRSDAPRQAHLELHSAVIALLLLGLLSVAGIIERGRDPLAWSAACALRAARAAMDGRTGSQEALLAALSKAEKDAYVRRRPKRSRCWPHKKNDPPPGKPHVRRATSAETKAARALFTARKPR